MQSLQGNQSRQFLKKVDLLQLELGLHSDDALLNGLPFIHTLRSFSKVVDSCFGMDLKETFMTDIAEFKRLYLSLGITVTPKVLKTIQTIFHEFLIFRLISFSSMSQSFSSWSILTPVFPQLDSATSVSRVLRVCTTMSR